MLFLYSNTILTHIEHVTVHDSENMVANTVHDSENMVANARWTLASIMTSNVSIYFYLSIYLSSITFLSCLCQNSPSEKVRIETIIWAMTWQNQQNECAPSEDSDQPGQLPSLIRVFGVCSMGS